MKRTNTAQWYEKYQRWQIQVQKDNERRTFYSSTPGRNGQREANRKADAWLDDGIDKVNLKVSALFDDFLSYKQASTSKSNWRQIQSIGDTWVKPLKGNKRISNLTEQDLQDIIVAAFQKGLSNKTLKNIRAALMNFLKYCRKRKVSTLFVEDLEIPNGAPSKEKRIVHPDALKVLFSVDTTIYRGSRKLDPYINAYRFEVLTGLRPGELIGLEWSDIKDNMVWIQRAVNKYGEQTKGKNKNARRHFVLTEQAKKVLDAQKAMSYTESVFEISCTQTYRKSWLRYCEANNIPYVSPYELRHTFVSIVKTLPDGTIRPLVGHSKSMDTFGIYGHEVKGELQKTAETVSEIFSKLLE